jgi:DNA-binding transcriptional ArsR family regulator
MDEVEKLAEIFKVLSDPTRLRLILLLKERSSGEYTECECGGGPLCVNALTQKLGVTQSAVSQHLRILRQVGLVRSERRGCYMHYSLDQEDFEKYRDWVLGVMGEDLIRR